MFSALPDACCKIRPRHFIGDSVPVEDQLERRLVGNGRNHMWEIVPLRCGSLLRALICLRRRELDGKFGILEDAGEKNAACLQIPSLPAFLLLRKTTQYHSLSSSTGKLKSDQLKASAYGVSE